MDKETKRRAKITIMGILGLVLLIIGISFAAFSANLAGVQVQTMNTGCLKVDMTDEGSVNTDNAMPETDESGLSGDPYTYKITNSCTTDAYYTTTINVMSTSKLENADKIKVALDGDSYLAPTIESSLPATELLDDTITGVSKTYKLDEGYLKVGETKTFELRTWIDYDVESISGSLENKIIINSVADNDGAITYNKNTAGYYVLSNNTKLNSVDYTKISPSTEQPSGVIEVKNNSGTTYHFRGNPNNYLKFAGNDNRGWRILSTNSDGSINIVMEDAQNFSTIDYNDNLTTLYNEVLGLRSYENYIKTDAKFCVENGSEGSNYIAEIKLKNHNPTGNCESNNTITKIGLLTVDDYMYAGGVNGLENQRFFLSDGLSYKINGYLANNNYYTVLDDTGKIDIKTANKKYAVKAVITLKSDTKLEGAGTAENPFYVSGKYGQTESNTSKDSIVPIIDKVSVDAKWSNQNKNIDIAARDNSTGSGLAGYIVKTENKTPTLTESGWEASTSNKYTTINKYDNGTYYVFAKDNAGNISEGRKIVIEKVDKEAPTCTIRINPNGTSAPYKTLSIISNDTNIDLDGYSWDHTNYTEDVVKVTENGSYTAHLKDLAGNKGSCTAVVTNVTQANEPAVEEGMIPVYYDETSETWKKADENNENNNWYNYNDKKWANSVTVTNDTRSKYKSASVGTEIPMDDILTMQVWIPRYKYKVWNYNANGVETSQPQQIEITWENGTDKTGEITCQDAISGTDGNPSETCKLKETNATCTDDTCNNKTYTHPAFTFGDEEIKGFWIGKFELTGTIDNITTKPDLTSLTNQSVSSFETNIMNMKNSGNSYGFATTSDTHMIKNMEWGAVAYLSHSKYGTCTDGTCKEVNLNNSSSNYTGRSGGSSSASSTSEGTYKYNQIKSSDGALIGAGQDGPSSSTTHNIYGVYDMSGGANEYVMGNIVNSDGTTMIPGVSGYTTSTYPDSKYYDKYSYSTSNLSRIRSKLGDGIKEVYSDGPTETTGWYKDFSYLAGSDGPWFYRGGNYGNAMASAGVFNSVYSDGHAYSPSSRLVITP